MYNKIKIGNRMFIARKNKQLKQYDVGNFLGINQSTYSAIETGKRDLSLPELYKLADFFDVSISWLLGLESDPFFTDNELLKIEEYKQFLIHIRK